MKKTMGTKRDDKECKKTIGIKKETIEDEKKWQVTKRKWKEVTGDEKKQ